MFRRTITLLFFLVLALNVCANPWIDSICSISDYLVIGTVSNVHLDSSDGIRYHYSWEVKIVQVALGGKAKNEKIVVYPGDTLRNLEYTLHATQWEPVNGDTTLFPLCKDRAGTVRIGNDMFSITTLWHRDPKYMYDYFNFIELYTTRSLKLSSSGKTNVVSVENNGKRLRRTEKNSDSVVVSVTDRYHEYEGTGPSITVTKLRTYDESGKKLTRYRQKVKQYGIGTHVRTWTFRRNGHLCLRFRSFHNPYTF